jgi:uncharacterized cupin superfamily protein
VIRHWDEVEPSRRERGHIAGEWRSLTGGVTTKSGVNRVRIDPGRWSTPAHIHGEAEEFVYVLDGSGESWQDGATYAIGQGDCVVHRPGEEAHTLHAGEEGLDVLIFGERVYDEAASLPRAAAGWFGAGWVRLGGEDDHPWAREAAVGPPELGELSDERPSTIVRVADVEAREREGETVGLRVRDLARAGDSERTGLRLAEVVPGKLHTAPHCHSAEEEIFVVLDGDGELELYADGPAPTERHAVRAGHTIARPPGTRVAHAFRAGEAGLTMLMYGTRDTNDVCYYPRSDKIFWRGVGVIGRIERLDYWDGEA